MKYFRKLLSCVILLCSFHVVASADDGAAKDITLVIPASTHVRIRFGAENLSKALTGAGYNVRLLEKNELPSTKEVIVIGKLNDALVKKAAGLFMLPADKAPGKEGFAINATQKGQWLIAGADDNGTLYGCLELAEQVRAKAELPPSISIIDQPEMVMRGTCIGIQKTTYLPGRTVYEYPYTPENFPWLYDKKLWLRFLDSMTDNRMNALYLWNGHPFASLVRVKEYPYAVEVDDATFRKNEEMFRFLTGEADKRGIWVIQMFYNIIVSKPFAEKNNLKTQDRNRHIVPIISDYTRKSIAEFVQKYPNVGLMLTLGEAMEGVGQDDIDWFTKTIIPGVKDGLRALGKTEEPPIVLRAHDTDAPAVMKAALPLYKNLYTEAKYNGEALTTYTPRGQWAELHRTLSRIGTVQIENVHILANLEPFRYGSADFIQKCVQAMHSIYEANGLHLFPQASYWDWPYTADKASPRILQLERDWIWYKTWSRYAWNCHRDRNQEISYWGKQLAAKYGSDEAAGKKILEAYEQAGEIAPKLLRRYGITDGNRQTLTLGMFMSQLINPRKYNLFELLYSSEGPEGEMLIEYADKEWKKQPHIGETPVIVADEVQEHGKKAVAAIELAAGAVKGDQDEFARLKNDMYCNKALADFYAEKARAALLVSRYKYSNDVNDLVKALPYLENSVASYQELTNLTKNSYLYANSMQTKQRAIPIKGVDGKYKTWEEMLPLYQRELNNFKKNIDSLKAIANVQASNTRAILNNVKVTLADNLQTVTINKGAQLFTDTGSVITEIAPELAGLRGIKLSRAGQVANGTQISFSNAQPVKVLVGFFIERAPYGERKVKYAPEPELETDASADDYGQASIKINNAVAIQGFAPVNVHTYHFKAGNNTLKLPKGACLILGFIDGKEEMIPYNAGVGTTADSTEVDWLFD